MILKCMGSIENLEISLKKEGGVIDSQLSKLTRAEKKYNHRQPFHTLMVPSHFIRI